MKQRIISHCSFTNAIVQPILNHFDSATLCGVLTGLVGIFVHLLGNTLTLRIILQAVKIRSLDPRTVRLLGSYVLAVIRASNKLQEVQRPAAFAIVCFLSEFRKPCQFRKMICTKYDDLISSRQLFLKKVADFLQSMLVFFPPFDRMKENRN